MPPPPTTPEQDQAPERWSVGDVVVNPGKPEWGAGSVTRAVSHRHQGTLCQQLTVRFDRGGIKTIVTAMGTLRRAGAERNSEASPGPIGQGASPANPEMTLAELGTLPESLADRSLPPASRLTDALAWFRFEGSGAMVLDWAIARTGWRDPLSRYSRNEIEEQHARFFNSLHGTLRSLVMDTMHQGPQQLADAVKNAPPQGRAAAQRALSARSGR